MNRRKILFVYHIPRGPLLSFIAQDLAILRRIYAVEELNLAACGPRMRHVISNPHLWRSVARNELVFGWFGACAPAVLLAHVLRRPSILVAGGADVVQMPAIGYGVDLRSRGQRLMVRGFRYARRILAFSESSRRSTLELPGVDPQRVQTLYLGVDSAHFAPAGPRRAQVLTVGQISLSNLRRKGLATFVEAAQALPDTPFRLAGWPVDAAAETQIRRSATPNLTFLGGLDDNALLAELRSAAVYAQLSLHEGFGLALAEAMACGCVPITTNCGAIPEVVGDTGLFVAPEDAQAAAQAIAATLADPQLARRGEQARARIVEHFPIARRAEGLHAAIETTVGAR